MVRLGLTLTPIICTNSAPASRSGVALRYRARALRGRPNVRLLGPLAQPLGAFGLGSRDQPIGQVVKLGQAVARHFRAEANRRDLAFACQLP